MLQSLPQSSSSPVLTRRYTTTDVDLIERAWQLRSQDSLWDFRRYVNPRMHVGWWQYEVARHLQEFSDDYDAGRRPKLILMAPPQHGKTKQVTDFIAWRAGRNPDTKIIFASYSNELGVKVNLDLQRVMVDSQYRGTFPGTRLSEIRSGEEGSWLRNTGVLEFVGRRGSFRNTTVEGQITGKELDLGVIDDPVKGRADVQSKTQRDKTWNWFTDDFFSRFSDRAGMLVIMTRWHVDDPVGRMIEKFPDAVVLRYPAIAEKDGRYRRRGEPLFPEHKSLEFLLERKAVQSQAGWESEYQQNPIIVGGGMFPIDKFGIAPALPGAKQTLRCVRYWDKAGTKDGGAHTAGVLMIQTRDKQYVVADARRGQWSALERERVIKQTAELDKIAHPSVRVWVEQEPGSGGKESAESTIRMLAGHVVAADRVTGDKVTRADPYAAQVQAGNVSLLGAEWNRTFLDEHETFPAGKYKDQVDAASGAFNKLATGGYDATLSWVR